MSEVLFRVKSKENGTWGPAGTSRRHLKYFEQNGYEIQHLQPVELVHGLSREERLERVALKYLDYLGLSNAKAGLELDLLDKEMLE